MSALNKALFSICQVKPLLPSKKPTAGVQEPSRTLKPASICKQVARVCVLTLRSVIYVLSIFCKSSTILLAIFRITLLSYVLQVFLAFTFKCFMSWSLCSTRSALWNLIEACQKRVELTPTFSFAAKACFQEHTNEVIASSAA